MPIPRIIAIDDPAASGKSTLGKRLADDLGYLFFDTGVMYRAVTWASLSRHVDISNETEVTNLAHQVDIDIQPPSLNDGRNCDILLDGEDITWQIRTPEVEANVSIVSAYPGVRLAMTSRQRQIGLRGKVVMVGRDIGTVVLPEAEVKIFLEASVEERAHRRYSEQTNRGERPDAQEILFSMQRRDEIDSTRTVAPLRLASDSIKIDSDNLNADEVFIVVKRLVLDR